MFRRYANDSNRARNSDPILDDGSSCPRPRRHADFSSRRFVRNAVNRLPTDSNQGRLSPDRGRP